MNITATDFNTLSGPLLVSAYNLMVGEAEAVGLAGYRSVTRFADRESAVRRCEALKSSLKARVSGEHYEDLREAGGLRSEPVPQESFALQQVRAVDTPKDTSPGRQRMLDSGRADELREQVLADQRAATAHAERREEKTKEEKAPVARTKKVKEPKSNGEWTLTSALTLWNSLVPVAAEAGIEGVKVRKSIYFVDVKTAIKCLDGLTDKFKRAGVAVPGELKAALHSLQSR